VVQLWLAAFIQFSDVKAGPYTQRPSMERDVRKDPAVLPQFTLEILNQIFSYYV
jgi:hypothetical protein